MSEKEYMLYGLCLSTTPKKCEEEMIGARQGEVSGVVMEGWGAQ